jgi:hypothetical protein
VVLDSNTKFASVHQTIEGLAKVVFRAGKTKLPKDYNFNGRERTLCIEESLNTHQIMPHMDDVVHDKIGAFALSLEVLI